MTKSHLVKLFFDADGLTKELERLTPSALEDFERALHGDLQSLPFDLFIREVVPASRAGTADEIIIGFRINSNDELIAAA